MQIRVRPGKYIVAVSGGVDSVVLLDLLVRQPDLQIVVAHFDHGIRSDSSEDRKLVATLSQKYDLSFEYSEGRLGAGTNEQQARAARYAFLQQIRSKHGADAIITAHHQDDVLETAAFNILRGTKRKGMSSLQSTDDIVRPLMKYSKEDIKAYAAEQGLVWREDSTNQDERFTRNWLRRKLLPRMSWHQKQQLEKAQGVAMARNAEVDEAVKEQLARLQKDRGLDRKKFITLPYLVATEVMAEWLRQQGVKEADRALIDRLVVSVKTLPPGKRLSVRKNIFMSLQPNAITLD